jgi:hypothetical protein
MKIAEYFEKNKGRGILSTADSAGNVNAAVYAKPHMMEDGQIAFIMRDRLTHSNISENPNAAYLFMAEGIGFTGLRLYLEKTAEERDTPKIEELHRRKRSYEEDEELGPKFLVYFRIKKILPLIGSDDPGVTA